MLLPAETIRRRADLSELDQGTAATYSESHTQSYYYNDDVFNYNYGQVNSCLLLLKWSGASSNQSVEGG